VRERPKQFLPLLGKESLVRMTANRIADIAPLENLLILTNAHLLDRAREEFPGIPEENLIGEPKSCNTAPCIALAAALCEKRWGGDTAMVVLSADHYIGDEEGYRRALRTALDTAREERCLVTLGIPPTRPETGYGYLELSKKFTEIPEGESAKLVRFREKPDAETATQYLAEGRHLWNKGDFVWLCSSILEEFERSMPDLLERARKAASASNPVAPEVMEEYYGALPKELCTSIDFGIMEQAENIRCVPCQVPWDDVGAWPVLKRLRGEEMDEEGNLSLIRHLSIDSRNNVVAGNESEHGVVVTAGVEGLVVVRDGEKVLVVAEDKIELMRQVVPGLKEKGWDHLL
jgi:mannose-1-phosphate guanylyltransferase